MFGFFKEMVLIGQVSSGLGKVVITFCGQDFLGNLSTRDRNLLAENTVKSTERLHGRKINNEFLPLDDLLINGFMLLAREIGPNNALDHRIVLIG